MKIATACKKATK